MNATETISRKIREHDGYVTALGRHPRRYILQCPELHPGTNFAARIEPRDNPSADLDSSAHWRFAPAGGIDVGTVAAITLHADTVVREIDGGFEVADPGQAVDRYAYGH